MSMARQPEGDSHGGMAKSFDDRFGRLPRLHDSWIDALWYRRSVREQIFLVFFAIDLFAVAIVGAVIILRAQGQTQVEINASMRLAELLVAETVSLLQQQQQQPAARDLANLPLQLRFVRHVRVEVTDADGLPIAYRHGTAATDRTAADRAGVPAWFVSLIAGPPMRRELPVVVGAQRIGSVVIVGEPGNEIAEVWANTAVLGMVALLVNFALIAVVYVVVRQALGPLTGLARGLLDLEHRNYEVRLSLPKPRELATIVDRFNELAKALEVARGENSALTQRLITAQDDERRRTALDLHDEVGPCLFGLKAQAASIATALGQPADVTSCTVLARVNDMINIVERLQALNRSMLKRLRPMALGHVPLRDLLAEFVDDCARRHTHMSFSLSTGKLNGSYGDPIDLTIYRCVQEALTNAVRHAQARSVNIDLGELDEGQSAGTPPGLSLTIRDDGRGIAPDVLRGFGVVGMQERVQALGGNFVLRGDSGVGTCVSITMPAGDHRSRIKPDGAAA
jgi:two-component system sensor histidine kinase UhpB